MCYPLPPEQFETISLSTRSISNKTWLQPDVVIRITTASRGHIANAGSAIVVPTLTPQVNRQRTLSPLKYDFKHDINTFVSDPIMNSSSAFHTELWD